MRDVRVAACRSLCSVIRLFTKKGQWRNWGGRGSNQANGEGQERAWRADLRDLAWRFVEQHERHHGQNVSESRFNRKLGVAALIVSAVGALLTLVTLIVVAIQTGAAWEAVSDGRKALQATKDAALAAQGQLAEARRQNDILEASNRVIYFASLDNTVLQENFATTSTTVAAPSTNPNIVFYFGPHDATSRLFSMDIVISGSIKNAGNVPAFLESGEVWLMVSSRLPPQPNYNQSETHVNVDVMTSAPTKIFSAKSDVYDKGKSLIFSERAHFGQSVSAHGDFEQQTPLSGRIYIGDENIYVYGRLVYTDEFSRRHTFGFGRRFDPKSGSQPNTWDNAGGDAYNYNE